MICIFGWGCCCVVQAKRTGERGVDDELGENMVRIGDGGYGMRVSFATRFLECDRCYMHLGIRVLHPAVAPDLLLILIERTLTYSPHNPIAKGSASNLNSPVNTNKNIANTITI